MSWRSNARMTGSNSSDLGAPRRWGGSSMSPAPPPPPPERDASREASAEGGPRKRRSRWGNEAEKVNLAGLPTAISSNVKSNELEGYAVTLRLEEVGRKLRSGDVVPEERLRSPSPPPAYDSHGRRTNTREVRYRRKLEDERQKLVEKAMKLDPNYRPPAEFYQHRRSGRPQEKVYIPVKEFPEINFFGLLVGPRGNSSKKMERESGGAKISIRGRGSLKEGKARPEGFAGDDDEDLHCLVVADTEEKVRKCVELINKVIETAASTPESANDHKRNQLRELASLNGTLRDDENQPCQNCGKLGHRKWECTEDRNFTANIVCRSCGGVGHMARDCLRARNAAAGGAPQQQAFDSEYANLMAELGEAPKEAQGIQPPAANLPPWRDPANWHPPQAPQERPQRGTYQNYAGVNPAGGYPGYQQQHMGGGHQPYGGGGGYPPQGYGGYGY